jgi:hypothetical protein
MWRQLVNAPARLGFVALVILAGGGSLLTHGGVTSTRSLAAGDVALTASDTAPSARQSPTTDGAAVDLYGNEVSDAIATYSLDPAGSLYELHSPQTELPRLAEPKS